MTASIGVAALFWWNPVGWVAGVTAALAIAGGVTAATASAVELGASYSGATTPEQDEATGRAIAAAAGFGSIGGIAGGVGGLFFADDPHVGFETGEAYGGFAEGAGAIAVSLPSFVRALPRLWRVIAPYGRGVLYAPLWPFLGGSGVGGGRLRIPRRAAPVRLPVADRVRQVEYLGTTPLLERSEDWARYQVSATGSRNEGVFRITFVDGESQIVLADRFKPRTRTILEAKFGDMGQMWDPTREAHIIQQAVNYVDITSVLGGRVGYYVSTERGATRLIQVFEYQFPNELKSGQLWVDWVPWKRR